MNFIKKNFKDKFILKDNILKIGKLSKIGKKVVSVYNKNPFPNFKDFESKIDLIHSVEKNVFLKDLKKLIGYKKSFIEVGSGTCQLSLSMAIGTNNEIISLDPTINSLTLGRDFAKKHNIKNISFLNASLFDAPIQEEYFDFVFCSGVLHHTENPQKGFNIISKWLKDEGIIIIGLYNKFGRIRTHFRQFIYRIFGSGNFSKIIIKYLDPHLRKITKKEQIEAWITDQYEHPVESAHTLDEVLRWFQKEKIIYLGSIPDCDLDGVYIGLNNMNGNKGSFINRLFSQIGMIFTKSGSEGGLFIVIGKKNKE